MNYKGDFIQVQAYKNADMRVINLEQCISDEEAVSGKTTIHANRSSMKLIKTLNADVVTLANNHIHDCGDKGIRDTLEELRNAGIPYAGAGENIEEAKKGIWLNEDTMLLSYCQYGTHYLRNVQCAEVNKPGVYGFSLEQVLNDLEQVEEGKCAVVTIHWAAEYVNLPPIEIIRYAKKILEHPKCSLIIGHHPHITLGKIFHNGKEAYLSLGNLMFSNFFIDTQQRLYQPQKGEKYAVTDMQMKVPCLTYKKWQWINRQGMLVTYDLQNRKVDEVIFTIQKDIEPVTTECNEYEEKQARKRFALLTRMYALPEIIYIPLSKLCMYFVYAVRKVKRIHFSYIGYKRKEEYK